MALTPNADGTFPDGYFAVHNEEVLQDIRSKTTIKTSVACYIDHLVEDGIALNAAGASQEQVKASLQAVKDQFETRAWPAIVERTTYKDIK